MITLNVLIDHIHTIENWDSEESFLRDAIFLSSAKLLMKCHQEIQINSIIMVPLLLRQVQENLILITGVEEKVITLKDFTNKKINPIQVMDSIKEKNPDIEQNRFDFFNHYFKGIKEMLNKYAHTNFEGIMLLFTERFNVYEGQIFNQIMMKYITYLVEGPFIFMANYVYNLNLETPIKENFQKELKEIGTLKYISRQFPDPIKKFIENSDTLNEYYKKLVSNLQDVIKQTNQLKKYL